MIIRNTADLLAHVGSVLQSKEFGEMKPSVEWAEEEMLIPAIGQEMYDVVDAALDVEMDASGSGSDSGSASVSSSGSGANEHTSYDDAIALAVKCARVVAHFAMFDYTIISDSRVTAQGLQIVETNTHKTAYEYQKRDRKKYHCEKADKALDSLLLFLEKNKDKYPEWKNNTSVYTATKSQIINNTQEFQQHVDIGSSRRTFMALKNSVRDVENMYIFPALGDAIFDKLKINILDGGTSETYTKLAELLAPAVANLATADALPSIIFRIAGETITIATYNPLSEKEQAQITMVVNNIIKSRQLKGANYLEKAVEFIKKTPDLFTISPYSVDTTATGGYNNSADHKHFVGF